MKMEIETISRSYVKPSSPTPPHLKTYNLSGIDQINPSLYNPVILFYPPDPTQQPNQHRRLKQSLSHTLSRYYPLAGKLKDSLSIDCCDAGAFYSEAKIVNSSFSSLTQFLDQLNLSTLRALLPIDAVEGGDICSPPPPGSHLLLLQETCFPCGGLAIGLLAAHNLLDGSSIASFILDWSSAAACRIPNSGGGGAYSGNPKFAGDSMFPQNEELFERLVAPGPSTATVAATKRGVTTRFVFHADGLASLKKKLKKPIENDNEGKSITLSRVQVVTTLFSSAILSAFESTSGSTSPSRPVVVTQAVNLRGKANPPFPSNSIGNYVINAVATLTFTTTDVAKILQDSVSKIDAEFVKGIQGEHGKSLLADAMREEDNAVAGAERRISFTSLSRSGLYDADFGWGKPVWIGTVPNDVVDFVAIMDTKDGTGLEVWACLEENEMAVLKNDKSILSFSSLEPSPNGNMGCV